MSKTTAAKLLKIAAAQIGIKESPANSNIQKFGKWYGMNGVAWCDEFVSWVAAQAGQSDIGKFAYCPYHVNHFKKNGQWLGKTKNPKPGDIVFFHTGNGIACHIGIVEKKINDTTVQTIEGNTSTGSGGSQDNGGCVARRTRYYNTSGFAILGFARPNYEGATATTSSSKKTSATSKNISKGDTVTVIAKSGLNARTSASTKGAVKDVYPYGTTLIISKTKNGWGYTQDKLWVSLAYVK